MYETDYISYDFIYPTCLENQECLLCSHLQSGIECQDGGFTRASPDMRQTPLRWDTCFSLFRRVFNQTNKDSFAICFSRI